MLIWVIGRRAQREVLDVVLVEPVDDTSREASREEVLHIYRCTMQLVQHFRKLLRRRQRGVLRWKELGQATCNGEMQLVRSLVVLSACESGIGGAPGAGEGGLVEAFLLAGVGAVVASQWMVHDLSSPPAAAVD
jgi:hypothetical protein